jgi:transcriptional regulator with XRE-family HTH domain
LGGDTSDGSPDMVSADEFAWQTWVVKNVEAMIVAATHLPSPTKERNARSLSLCIDHVSEGIMNRFASLIGKRKNTVWGWQHGKTNIPINDLLRICDRVGLSLVDFLYTDALTPYRADHPTVFPISDTAAISRSRRPFDSAVIGRRLRTAAEHHPPLSMKEVAKILNINKRFLYKHFAEICKAIAARHAEYQRARQEEGRSEKEKTFRQISKELQAHGIYPSRRRVAVLMAKRSELRNNSSRKSSTGKNSQMAA